MLKVVYFILGSVSLAAFIGGAGLAYLGVLPPVAGFGLCAFGCLSGVVVFVIGVVVVARKGPKSSLIAAGMGTVPVLFLVYSLFTTAGSPLINDVSTELVYPPLFKYASTLPENEGRDMTMSEETKVIIEENYSDLTPVAVEGDAEEILLMVSDLARAQRGWSVERTTFDLRESVIEGVAESGVFRFKDDFVIRVTATDLGAVVDMRSKSRDGKGDMGANAKRIRDFMAQLQPPGKTSPSSAE